MGDSAIGCVTTRSPVPNGGDASQNRCLDGQPQREFAWRLYRDNLRRLYYSSHRSSRTRRRLAIGRCDSLLECLLPERGANRRGGGNHCRSDECWWQTRFVFHSVIAVTQPEKFRAFSHQNLQLFPLIRPADRLQQASEEQCAGSAMVLLWQQPYTTRSTPIRQCRSFSRERHGHSRRLFSHCKVPMSKENSACRTGNCNPADLDRIGIGWHPAHHYCYKRAALLLYGIQPFGYTSSTPLSRRARRHLHVPIVFDLSALPSDEYPHAHC